MRAQIFFENFYKGTDNPSIDFTFDGMVAKVLKIPSYKEVACCTASVKNYPMVQLNHEIFVNDLSNLQRAIEENLLEIPICKRCKKKPEFTREFANHVFINVSSIIISIDSCYVNKTKQNK